MLNEESASDRARRYAAALLAEGRVRLRDELPSVPGELVAEVLWRIETALPHMSRGLLELELLEVNKLKGAAWRKYTTARNRGGEEAQYWGSWAQIRQKIAQQEAHAHEEMPSVRTANTDVGTSLPPIQPINAAIGDSEYDPETMIMKPLSKGFANDGAPMTFARLRRIVIRSQVLLIEYASQRCGDDEERLLRMLCHQSTAALIQLETIDAWEACHRLLRRMADSGSILEDEQSVFDVEFETLRQVTLTSFQNRLKIEADLLEKKRKHYGDASSARR